MRPQPVQVDAAFAAAVGAPVLAELLWRRGARTPEEVSAWFGDCALFVDSLPALATSPLRLAAAVRQQEPIFIFGDYDADGVTSTALLVALLRHLGVAADWHVPDRFTEGYGLTAAALERVAPGSLLVTVDCGITAVAEVALATARGIDVIITDHHALGPELPAAAAVINPKRLPVGHPLDGLTGVGVAWLLAKATLAELGRDEGEADRWLDLVAVGLIADRAPLRGAARQLCRQGLHRLRLSPCAGLRELLAVAGAQGAPTEEEVAFQIVPRLNAAGRIAHAAAAVRLLLAEHEREAHPLAQELDRCNRTRRELTAAMEREATELAAAQAGAGALALYRPEWHEGCIGIAAGQLAAKHGRPALLLTRRADGETAVGSARAPEGYPLLELLGRCATHLTRWGGHAAAAGFSLPISSVARFLAAVAEAAAQIQWEPPPPPGADLEIPLGTVGEGLLAELEQAGPFGEGNPAPLLFSPSVQVLSARPIGDGQHLRLVVRDGDLSFSAVWFGAGAQEVALAPVHLVYRVGRNRHRGQETLQLLVHALIPPETAAVAKRRAGPELVDRRGEDPVALREAYPHALIFAEGLLKLPFATADRYAARPAGQALFLDLPPSVGVLEEVIALSGASQVIFGWSAAAPRGEDRFFPSLMRLLAEQVDPAGAVRLPELAVGLRELEATVAEGLEAMEASYLLAVLEKEGDLWRVRRREGTVGLRDGPALARARRLLAETRAFRRHFRTAPMAALAQALRL